MSFRNKLLIAWTALFLCSLAIPVFAGSPDQEVKGFYTTLGVGFLDVMILNIEPIIVKV